MWLDVKDDVGMDAGSSILDSSLEGGQEQSKSISRINKIRVLF